MSDSKKNEAGADSQENERLNGKAEHDQDQTAVDADTTSAPKYKGVCCFSLPQRLEIFPL